MKAFTRLTEGQRQFLRDRCRSERDAVRAAGLIDDLATERARAVLAELIRVLNSNKERRVLLDVASKQIAGHPAESRKV